MSSWRGSVRNADRRWRRWVVTLVVLVCGGILPKTLAVGAPLVVARLVGPSLRVVQALLHPLAHGAVRFTDGLATTLDRHVPRRDEALSENEIKMLVTMGWEHGVVGVREKEFIHNVFHLNDRVVKDIMTPRTRVFAVDIDAAIEDVRLAIAHAIDKQELVDIVFQGLGEPLDTIVPPTLGGGFWHNPNIQDVSFDLVRANQILEEAGYTLGSDGVRAKGDVHLDFRLQFPSDKPIYPGIADLLASWFQQAGIKATPESVDPDSLKNATTPTGDFDLVLWGWGPDPDPDFILGVMTSDQFIEGGWNDSGYMNPEYDHLYLDQQMTVDQLDRQQIIWDMQELVFDDRPYIVLLNENLLQAYREERFTGFIASPLGIEYVQSLVQVEPVR